MKTRWLTPCLLLLASCASFAGDDTKGLDDEDVDAASPEGEEDAAADATSSVVTPPEIVGEEDAGEDAGTVDAEPPPVDELTETYGIFVSLAGSAEGDGTREAPLSTIGAGIAKAKKDGKRVYVCKGTYKEAVELKSGVSVFGGYACTTKWMHEDHAYSRVESPTSPAIRAKDITDATTFSGFDVVAPDGSAASASSIGLIADNAVKLVVADSKITAGKGADGAPGVEPAAPVPGPNVDGKAGSGGAVYATVPTYPMRTTAGAVGASTCGGGTGGEGGIGAFVSCSSETHTVNGHSITFYRSTVPSKCYVTYSVAGGPVQYTSLGDCSPGTPGAGAGTAGKAGVDGASASSIGGLSSTGYVSADGVAGASGQPGAGGQGGNPQPVSDSACSGMSSGGKNLAAGGGGGAGGCGGIAGTPGKGGGASIAALVWSSPGLVFEDTLLFGGEGGAGGKGTLGAAPTAGGKAGGTATGAGAAANGGNGGRPGVSGSGAGGPSFGVAVHGPSPKFLNGALAKSGQGGTGVAAESKTSLGVTWKLPASAAGLSKDIYEF